MWKAIGWGFGGLVLGLALGASLGAAAGAIVGTVVGSVLGALPPLLSWRRACSSPCRGCAAVCEQKSSGVPAAAVAVLAVVVAAPVALSAVVPFIPAAAATIGVMCVAGILVVRHLVLYGRQRKPRPVRQRAVRPALARGPLALENKTITVTPAMFVKEEKVRHVQ